MAHARTLAAFALVVAAFATLATILTSGTPATALQAAPAVETPTVQVDPFLVSLVGAGVDLPADHAAELLLAADRVCEGITAEVPVVDMADALVRDLGLTDEEARHFVNTAAMVHCLPTN
jgi:hypothetical protein